MQSQRPRSEGLLVLDYGSQYTLLIARRLRELGFYAEVIDGTRGAPPEGFAARGIILSGGPDTVGEADSRSLPPWVLEADLPVLGICYGVHLLADAFGGKVRSATTREYGHAELHLASELHGSAAKAFCGLPQKQSVWMSHGDDVEKVPDAFEVIGKTRDAHGEVIAIIAHREKPIVGLQFHPEVQHTAHGADILQRFARDLCRLKNDWQPASMLTSLMASVRENVGDGRVLMAVSGGVDSTVAAALIAKALGSDRLTTVFVDHGLLRKKEAAWVQGNLKRAGLSHIVTLESADLFLSALRGVTDPEEKRRIIGRTFIEEFERYAKSHGPFTHLGQGTLYPDVIESAGHGAGAKVIKSHHNVGGLPERLALKLVEPFRFLFKDEVRLLAKELHLPDDLVHRHPFPGPGLAVRILGSVTRENIALLQEADALFIEGLRAHGLYEKVWQAFAVLLPVSSVGVMGDNRTYQQTICLRTVTSTDGMTASVGELPMAFLLEMASSIVKKVSGINRVVYDLTSKPPATIEWE